MATSRQLVAMLESRIGKPYVFGAEVRLSDPSPRAFDCSEIIEWGCARIGVKFPDGSANQIARCQAVSVDYAIKTPGALLYKPGHIVTSRGDGTTIEARGRAWGVGIFASSGRGFTRGGLIPGLTYSQPAVPPVVDLYAIAQGIAAAKTQTLRIGSRGDAVIWCQVGLNNLAGAGLAKDGVYGPATANAVMALQRWTGLTVDGIVGPRTWALIYP